MWRIPLTLKLTTNLVFSILGCLLLGIALLHAGRTLLAINLPAASSVPQTSSVEQSITKALELVTSQTSSD